MPNSCWRLVASRERLDKEPDFRGGVFFGLNLLPNNGIFRRWWCFCFWRVRLFVFVSLFVYFVGGRWRSVKDETQCRTSGVLRSKIFWFINNIPVFPSSSSKIMPMTDWHLTCLKLPSLDPIIRLWTWLKQKKIRVGANQGKNTRQYINGFFYFERISLQHGSVWKTPKIEAKSSGCLGFFVSVCVFVCERSNQRSNRNNNNNSNIWIKRPKTGSEGVMGSLPWMTPKRGLRNRNHCHPNMEQLSTFSLFCAILQKTNVSPGLFIRFPSSLHKGLMTIVPKQSIKMVEKVIPQSHKLQSAVEKRQHLRHSSQAPYQIGDLFFSLLNHTLPDAVLGYSQRFVSNPSW